MDKKIKLRVKTAKEKKEDASLDFVNFRRIETSPNTYSNKCPNGPISVTLFPDEDVEWIKSQTANGFEYISGFNIVPKKKKRVASKRIVE